MILLSPLWRLDSDWYMREGFFFFFSIKVTQTKMCQLLRNKLILHRVLEQRQTLQADFMSQAHY